MPHIQADSKHLAVIVASAGTAQQLSETDLWVLTACLMAKKADDDNETNIHISPNSSLVAGSAAECIEIAPGDYWNIPVSPGTAINLAQYYIDADTTADAVQIIYTT